jgi:UDP-N-acetylglucosamine:LPS N-acetylglucosamine transferase
MMSATLPHSSMASQNASSRHTIDAAVRPTLPADCTPGRSARNIDVLLVSSPGGHLLELFALRDAWADLERAWVTMDRADTRSILDGEEVAFAHRQVPRSLRNVGRNLILSWRLMTRFRPRVIVTTGAALAVPFIVVGWIRGVRIVFVESATRIEGPSLTLRLVARLTDRIYVQWPEGVRFAQGARYRGNVLSPES